MYYNESKGRIFLYVDWYVKGELSDKQEFIIKGKNGIIEHEEKLRDAIRHWVKEKHGKAYITDDDYFEVSAVYFTAQTILSHRETEAVTSAFRRAVGMLDREQKEVARSSFINDNRGEYEEYLRLKEKFAHIEND